MHGTEPTLTRSVDREPMLRRSGSLVPESMALDLGRLCRLTLGVIGSSLVGPVLIGLGVIGYSTGVSS